MKRQPQDHEHGAWREDCEGCQSVYRHGIEEGRKQLAAELRALLGLRETRILEAAD